MKIIEQNTNRDEKQILRKIFREKRRQFLSEKFCGENLFEINSYDAATDKIFDNFCQFFMNEKFKNLAHKFEFFSQKTFGLYFASEGEVETNKIAEFLQKQNHKISYPKITAIDAALDFIEVNNLQISSKKPFEVFQVQENFIPSQFFKKILEPKNGKIVEPEIVLVPLLAFDSKGLRLGMGGGFYDRTLEKLRQKLPNLLAIGLAFDWQFYEQSLPIEPCDQALDAVICESKIFEF